MIYHISFFLRLHITAKGYPQWRFAGYKFSIININLMRATHLEPHEYRQLSGRRVLGVDFS